MNDPKNMTVAQLVNWITKTRRSISNRPASMGLNSERAQNLVDRYMELQDEMVETDMELWREYCDKNRLDVNHNVYDMFA